MRGDKPTVFSLTYREQFAITKDGSVNTQRAVCRLKSFFRLMENVWCSTKMASSFVTCSVVRSIHWQSQGTFWERIHLKL